MLVLLLLLVTFEFTFLFLFNNLKKVYLEPLICKMIILKTAIVLTYLPGIVLSILYVLKLV